MKLGWHFLTLVLGTKFGTDASFAGDQNKVTISTKIDAVYSQK
jgi:hypothetical protein